MNTIPKFNLKVIDLKNEFDIKNYFFDQKYSKRRNIYWKNSELELIGIDFLVSSDFSNKNEYQDLITYYKSIIEKNQTAFSRLDVPIIFMGSAFNLKENIHEDIWKRFPKGRIFIPKILIISNKAGQRAVLFDLENLHSHLKIPDDLDIPLKSPLINLLKTTDKDSYKSSVNKAIQIIEDNQLSKIVLSRKKSYSISSKENLLSHFMLNKPTEDNTTNFVLDFQESGTIFGSSPETLFRVSDNHLRTEALAGSFSSEQNIDLTQKKKELQEHNIVVDYLKEQLSNFSNDIKVYKNEIMKLNKISHIRTKLESTINDKHDVFDIIYQIHPTPAVAGTPKNISIQTISKLESHNRGWYAGTLGWINNKLDAHFIVNIRSGIIKENLLNIYAGCGITKDSSPEEEYNESEVKFDYILSKLNNE